MRLTTCLMLLALCATGDACARSSNARARIYSDYYLDDAKRPASLRDCSREDRFAISYQLAGTGSPWRQFCYGRPALIPPKRAPRGR